MFDTNQDRKILVQTNNLCKRFLIKRTLFDAIAKKPVKTLRAVDDVSIDIYVGENLGLVGESGCGKSTLARTIIRLYEPDDGKIFFNGKNLTDMNKNELRKERKNFQMIFQDPYSSLNPRMSIREILEEELTFHKVCTKKDMDRRIIELLEMVGLGKDMADRFPGEFSGGQRQRVGIARAIALNPKFIIADEPVSALDVSIQAQIINLLEELQKKLDLTILFISHDLRVVKYITHRVAVMYLGKIVELSDTDELYDNPLHPYTKVLLKASPNLDPRIREEKNLIEGDPPSPIDLPKGCRFNPRCTYASDICFQQEPKLEEKKKGHFVACHFSSI